MATVWFKSPTSWTFSSFGEQSTTKDKLELSRVLYYWKRLDLIGAFFLLDLLVGYEGDNLLNGSDDD